jgi:ribonuclease HI
MSDKATIFADGGSRGNPGPAGCGAVILVGEEQLATVSEYLGVATNNVAEYKGLVFALEKALSLGISEVEVFMDSELVVKQMKGLYKVKNAGLIPLFMKAQRLRSDFSKFDINHVRREHNKIADSLANKAMDGAMA